MQLQKIIQQKQAVSAKDGSITLKFDPAPMGYVLTGTITITNAPVGSQWTVLNNGQPVDIANSSLSIGNVQGRGNEVITLTSTGIQSGTTILATWVAVLEDENTANLVVPQHDSVQPLAGYAKLLFSGQIASNGAAVSLPNNPYTILPTTRSLIITMFSPQAFAGATGFPTVVGVASTINWAAFATPGLQVISGTGPSYAFPAAIVIPCYGVVDSLVNISVTSLNGANPINVVVAESPDEIALGSPQLPIAIVDPLGAFFGTRTVLASGGVGGILVSAPPVGFMNEVKMAGVWTNGVPTASVNLSLFDTATSTDYAGGFCLNGTPFINRISYVNMFTLNSLSFGSQSSGVGVVYEVFTRVVPIIQAIP